MAVFHYVARNPAHIGKTVLDAMRERGIAVK